MKRYFKVASSTSCWHEKKKKVPHCNLLYKQQVPVQKALTEQRTETLHTMSLAKGKLLSSHWGVTLNTDDFDETVLSLYLKLLIVTFLFSFFFLQFFYFLHDPLFSLSIIYLFLFVLIPV